MVEQRSRVQEVLEDCAEAASVMVSRRSVQRCILVCVLLARSRQVGVRCRRRDIRLLRALLFLVVEVVVQQGRWSRLELDGLLHVRC